MGEFKADFGSVPQAYNESFSDTVTCLKVNLQQRCSGQRMSVEDTAQQQRMRGKDSVEQCLSGQTDQAQSIAFEDVSAAEHAQQVIVSTSGDRILARKVIAGVRTTQWLGQMSDNSLQKLSQDRIGSSSYESCMDSMKLGRQTYAKFEQEHGAGYKLT
jgi:hypothetical protein